MARGKRSIPEINAGSMADIAFLLLVFFLITTTMDTDKGVRVKLPPLPDPSNPPPISAQNNRNVLEVLVNYNDQLLVEKELLSVEKLTEMTKRHITNEGRLPNFSVSSTDAIVSLKNSRGTTYNRYVQVYNEITRAYNEVREEYAQRKFGKSYESLRKEEKEEVDDKYPIKISEAEPDSNEG